MTEKISTTGNYYSAAQLASMRLPGKPTSKKQWYVIAEDGLWPFIEVKSAGRKGLRRDYQPPPDIQALIDARQRGDGAPAAPSVLRAAEPPVQAVSEPDWELLEALLRVAEHKLKGQVTVELVEHIHAVFKNWLPVAPARPDLLSRIKIVLDAADFLRPE